MRVYVAMPSDNCDFDEILVAESLDGIKNKCEKWCRECLYDELVNIQTEVTNSDTEIFVHITGEDPEDVYPHYSYGDTVDTTFTFLMRTKETEELC